MSNVVGRLGELEQANQERKPYEKPKPQTYVIGVKFLQYFWDLCEELNAIEVLKDEYEKIVAMPEDLRQLAREMEEWESPSIKIRWEEL